MAEPKDRVEGTLLVGSGGRILAETANLSEVKVEKVEADLVRVRQGRAGAITATEVDLRQSRVMRVHAEKVRFQQSNVGVVESAASQASESNITFGRANTAKIEGGVVGVLYSMQTEAQGSNIGLLLGREVHADSLRPTVLLAGNVNGPVETLLDTRQALLVGLTAGLAMGLLNLAGKLLLQHRK